MSKNSKKESPSEILRHLLEFVAIKDFLFSMTTREQFYVQEVFQSIVWSEK